MNMILSPCSQCLTLIFMQQKSFETLHRSGMDHTALHTCLYLAAFTTRELQWQWCGTQTIPLPNCNSHCLSYLKPHEMKQWAGQRTSFHCAGMKLQEAMFDDVLSWLHQSLGPYSPAHPGNTRKVVWWERYLGHHQISLMQPAYKTVKMSLSDLAHRYYYYYYNCCLTTSWQEVWWFLLLC